MINRRLYPLVIGFVALSNGLASAQLTLSEAEKISTQTGRTLFVVAGKKT